VWVGGDYEWHGRQYQWHRGHYEHRPHVNARYVRGHWEVRVRGRAWVAGHWE
jgi:hypothetical protein